MLYYNTPSDYLTNEHDRKRLDALRRIDITLAIGRDDPSCANNEYFSGILGSKDIWHAQRLWDGWAYDWPYWKQMVSHYIDGHDWWARGGGV